MITRTLAAILVTALMVLPAQAGLIVTIEHTTFVEGETDGTIDVFVRAETGMTVDLDNFGLEFRITPGSPRQIQFAPTQTFPGLTTATSPDYVFAISGGNPFGIVDTDSFANDTFIGGDFSTSGPVTVTDTDMLLTRLQFVPGPGGLAPLAGDVFTISLIEGLNTYFDDGNFSNDILFSSSSGSVTVVSDPIPEPSSLVLFLGLAGTVWAGRKWHGRRRRRTG